jgi:hypothetical protein
MSASVAARWRAISVAALAVLAMSLAGPARAGAQVPTTIVGETSLQGQADSFLVPGPPGKVRVVVGPCPSDASVQGCHSSGTAMDTIWLNPATGGLDSETFAHEMGHVFESYMWNLYWGRHARFVPRLLRRIEPLLGLEPSRGLLSSTVWTERFAEAYSLCARVGTLSDPVTTGYYGFAATPEQHAGTCSLIDSLGTDYEGASRRARLAR